MKFHKKVKLEANFMVAPKVVFKTLKDVLRDAKEVSNKTSDSSQRVSAHSCYSLLQHLVSSRLFIIEILAASQIYIIIKWGKYPMVVWTCSSRQKMRVSMNMWNVPLIKSIRLIHKTLLK